jgi:hypothetical protein
MFYHYAPIEGNKGRLVELDRRRLLAVDHDEDLKVPAATLQIPAAPSQISARLPGWI